MINTYLWITGILGAIIIISGMAYIAFFLVNKVLEWFIYWKKNRKSVWYLVRNFKQMRRMTPEQAQEIEKFIRKTIK